MTDFERDELLHAVLDGEATADDAALVAGDPELVARMVELDATREALAASVTPPDGLLDRQINAALDVFDSLESDESAAPVVTLASRRPAWFAQPAAQAAAIFLVLVAVGSLFALVRDDGPEDNLANVGAAIAGEEADAPTADEPPTAALESADAFESADDAVGAGAVASNDGAISSTTAASPLAAEAPQARALTLLEATDSTDLVNQLRQQIQALRGQQTLRGPVLPAPNCDLWVSFVERDDLLVEVDVDFDGRLRRAFVLDGSDYRRMVLVDLRSCSVTSLRDF